MRFKFKSRPHQRLTALLTLVFLLAAVVLLGWGRSAWSIYDYKALDGFFRRAVNRGEGPRPSFIPRIVYLTITDETYDYFGKNVLDRTELAPVNTALADLRPAATAYDIIFARPSTPAADRAFADSLNALAPVYLPIGFAISPVPARFQSDSDGGDDQIHSRFIGSPEEIGHGRPFHAVRALVQHEPFAAAATGTGDISVWPDDDGIYRHLPLLIKVDEQLFPTLSLSMFLDWVGVSLDEATVEWGRRIILPASPENRLDRDLVIPIDEGGRAHVPFVDAMGEDFDEVAVHTLLDHIDDPALRGNLADLFEGGFVWVADVASGISDLGTTPLERSTPLVSIHASMLNGLLTRTFYDRWSPWPLVGLLSVGILFMAAASLPQSSWVLYLSGPLLLAGLVGLTWVEMTHFRLFPIVTMGAAVLIAFFGFVVALEISASRERAFIRETFARYLPEAVVSELLADPDRLQLGGEERVATVLFSDLADFTTISEAMKPPELVSLLNSYLTEMAEIILKTGGIIDKYQGDAIMAEFGIPLPQADHADRAVMAGIEMQRRLTGLRETWAKQSLPPLRCRVGINSGEMVVGNMGSADVLDYTVIGDNVNLASRLEGANKWYGTELMISEATRSHLTPGRFRTRLLDVIRVKGKIHATRVYEVYGTADDSVSEADETYYRTYEAAFGAYLDRDFTAAEAGFREALALRPDDPASREMLARIAAIDPQALPDDWDGSVQLTRK